MPNCFKSNDQLKQNKLVTCAPNGLDMDSTILQTANLMTKSVLLSPTFAPDVANMPGELEIACAVNYQKITSNCKENVDSNAMNTKHNITEADLTVTNSHHKSKKEIQPIKNLGKENYKNVENGVDMLVDNSKQEINTKIMEPVAQDTENVVMDILAITDKAIPTADDPDDNIYTSYCSKNNPELTWIPHPENSTTQADIELNNKISILSEQILSPSQFKELKHLHNPNSNVCNFLPVPINSLITTDKLTDDYSNQNTIGSVPATANELKQNLESISKGTVSTVQNNFQNSETILMYDDKGVIINPENCNGNVDVDFPIHIVGNESLTLDEKYTVAEEVLAKVENSVELIADSNFDVCMDFNVSDIEKHLEENEEILESFVNEITGNDAHAIIEIKGQEASPKKTREVIVTECVGSNPAANICQYQSIENQAHNNELIVDKLASPDDHYCSKNNNRSGALYDPSHVIEKVKTVHESEFVNKNVSKDDAVIKAIDAPQRVKDSILKKSEHKSSTNCRVVQNSKNTVKPEGSCPLSVSVNITTNLNLTRDVNTADKLKCYDQFKNNVDKETVASENNNNKEMNLIVKEYNSKAGLNSTNNMLYTSDNVEDIAMLLCQIARRRSESIKPLGQSIDHKWLHAKCQETYKPRSKMHIQGVEKPGGSETVHDNITTSIKTYRKSNKPKQIPEFITKTIVIQDKVKTDLLSSTVESSKYDQERNSVDFCLCKDFGSLTCYDDERLYEHVHFLDHKKINCDTQLLFSIYNEEEDANKENNNKEIQQESPSTCAYSICWNNCLNNDVTVERSPDCIDKACNEVNNISDFSTNIYFKTGIEQTVTDKMIIKSSESSNHSSVEIDASLGNESNLSERIQGLIPNCEPGSNIDVQKIHSEAKTVSDQMENLTEYTMKDHIAGTNALSNRTPKNFETCQIENVQTNLRSRSTGENEDSSLRPVKVRKST